MAGSRDAFHRLWAFRLHRSRPLASFGSLLEHGGTVGDSPTLADLTARVRAFADARDWERFHTPRNLAMAVAVEAGELLELYLWSSDGGPQPIHPDRVPRVADEAADVLICLLNLCDRAGVDLGEAVAAKLARAEVKYPAERVRGQALKYDEYAEWDGKTR
jgi:NTP pyrophosphatase (non-canonical NTP hydrolase)